MIALRRLFACEAGQALVETALCMPILALLLTAMIDFGRLSQAELSASSSAHAGVQYGSQNSVAAQDISGMEAAATNDFSGVASFAFSYYTCADGTVPTTTYTGQSMSQQRIVQNDCASTHQLLYVVVTSTETFNAYFFTFLNQTITATAIMQVPT